MNGRRIVSLCSPSSSPAPPPPRPRLAAVQRAAIAAQMGRPRPLPRPAIQVLVARTTIHTGRLVKPDDLRWQPWPQGNLPPSFIVEDERTIGDFVSAVARSPFHVGEPIVENDIVMPGTRGFLAAVLKPGLRAVSIPATATSTVSASSMPAITSTSC